jgi:hypothetical protein
MEKEETKLKFYPTEKVEILPIKRTLKGHRYAVTNYGRVIRFGKTPEDGGFARQYTISIGYPCVFIQDGTKRRNAMVHRLVAEMFLPKPAKDQVFVIHKDRDIKNNHVSNLKWASKAEHLEHAMGSEAWKKSYSKPHRYKLTEGRVRMLKRRLKEGKTRMKMLAKQFGVTDMQLYRIKTGENWGWVK